MGFTIKVTGLDQVLRKLPQFPEKIQREIGGELKLAAQEVRRQSVKDVPVNNGQLKNAIIVDQQGPVTHTVTVEKGYGPYVEWGTKSKALVPAEVAAYASQFKGKGPGNGGVTLNEAIFQWVKRKGIGLKKTKTGRGSKSADSLSAQRSAAYAIATEIYKKGSKPHPFFFKNVFAVRDKLKQRIENIVNNMKL